MLKRGHTVRNANLDEFEGIGQLMVQENTDLTDETVFLRKVSL